MLTANASTWITCRRPPEALKSSGPLTVWSTGSNRPGSNGTATRRAGTAAATRAHQRHRDESSVPVGVSSRTNPISEIAQVGVAA